MIFRLFAKLPVLGWILLCSVEAPDPRSAIDEARQLIKPEHAGLPMKLIPETEKAPKPDDP